MLSLSIFRTPGYWGPVRLENNILRFRKKFGAGDRDLGIVVVVYDVGIDVITKKNHGELEKMEEDGILRDSSI